MAMTGRYERVGVITGVARRRRWSAEEKLRMVNELSRPGATVSLVARRNDINSSLLFKWRKLAREGAFGALPDGVAGFVPVRLACSKVRQRKISDLRHATHCPLRATTAGYQGATL